MDVALGLGLFLFGCAIGALVTRIFYRGLIRACFDAITRNSDSIASTNSRSPRDFVSTEVKTATATLKEI
jgi:hypothetical protein